MKKIDTHNLLKDVYPLLFHSHIKMKDKDFQKIK